MGVRLWSVLVAVALAAAPPAPGSGPGTAVATQPEPAAPFALGTDLRDEYLAGQAIVVRLSVENIGKEPRPFADLAQRPHLVRFDLVSPAGKKTARFSTPPEVDSAAAWTLAPGSKREVMVEIPGAAALEPGAWQLSVTVRDGSGVLSAGPRAIRISAPKPVAAHGPWRAGLATKGGLQTAWVHAGAQGHQLYLHVADAEDPRRTTATQYLAQVDGPVHPVFAWAPAAQVWARHVYWAAGPNVVRRVQLDGPGRVGPMQQFDAPWPRIELVGTGVTDDDGGLHVPIWVPAPKGDGGEIRVASVRDGSLPAFRRVVPLPKRPDHVTTAIDGGANLRLVLLHAGKVDLYTLDTAPNVDLPARGLRIDVTDGATVLLGRFADLPASESDAGGLALLLAEELPATPPASPDGPAPPPTLRGRWVSPAGTVLRTLTPVPRPPGEIIDWMGLGADGWVALFRDAQGEVAVHAPGHAPQGIALGADPELFQDAQGQPWLRHWTPKGPAVVRLLAPTP
jgi:hypothetical protein